MGCPAPESSASELGSYRLSEGPHIPCGLFSSSLLKSGDLGWDRGLSAAPTQRAVKWVPTATGWPYAGLQQTLKENNEIRLMGNKYQWITPLPHIPADVRKGKCRHALISRIT